MMWVIRGHLSEKGPSEQGPEGKERGRESAMKGKRLPGHRKGMGQGLDVRISPACLKESKQGGRARSPFPMVSIHQLLPQGGIVLAMCQAAS